MNFVLLVLTIIVLLQNQSAHFSSSALTVSIKLFRFLPAIKPWVSSAKRKVSRLEAGGIVETVDWKEAVEASFKFGASPEGSDWWQNL